MSTIPWMREVESLFIRSLSRIAIPECFRDNIKPIAFPLSNCSLPPRFNFPDGVDSWGLRLNVDSQELCVVPSTIVNNTVIVETTLCEGDGCQYISRGGGGFNLRETTSTYRNIPVQWLAPDPFWNDFNAPFGGAGEATIQFSSETTLPRFPFALASEDLQANHLGLANDSALLRSFVSAGLSPSLSFGLSTGSQSISYPRDGKIVFGGFDAAAVDGAFTNYSISHAATKDGPACPIQVDVLKIILRRPNLPDFAILPEGHFMTSCIEPYDDLFRFPRSVLDSFTASTGWQNHSSLIPPDLSTGEEGIYYNAEFNGSLVLSLGGGMEVEIPSYELAGPLRGIDKNGNNVVNSDITVVNIFNGDTRGNTAVLGRRFLSQLYLIVNYESQQFQLAPVVSIDSNLTSDLRLFESIRGARDANGRMLSRRAIWLIMLGCALAITVFLARPQLPLSLEPHEICKLILPHPRSTSKAHSEVLDATHIWKETGSAVETCTVRVHWTCKCGKQLFDDFKETRPSAAQLFQAHLNRPRARAGSSSPNTLPNSAPTTSFLRTPSTEKTDAASLNSEGVSLPDAARGLGHPPPNTTAAFLLPNTDIGPFPEQLWLLTCVEKERFTTKLEHFDADPQKIRSDMDFARMVKQQYLRQRPKWKRLLRLRGLCTIRFCQFELHRSQVVDIGKCPDMPKESDNNYSFLPTGLLPPVGERYLMHLLEHPEHYKEETITYQRVPKKRGAKLIVGEHEDVAIGWGIYLVEGFLMYKILSIVTGILISFSVVFATVWSARKGDIQTAFAVAGYICALPTLLIGCFVAYFE